MRYRQALIERLRKMQWDAEKLAFELRQEVAALEEGERIESQKAVEKELEMQEMED